MSDAQKPVSSTTSSMHCFPFALLAEEIVSIDPPTTDKTSRHLSTLQLRMRATCIHSVSSPPGFLRLGCIVTSALRDRGNAAAANPAWEQNVVARTRPRTVWKEGRGCLLLHARATQLIESIAPLLSKRTSTRHPFLFSGMTRRGIHPGHIQWTFDATLRVMNAHDLSP